MTDKGYYAVFPKIQIISQSDDKTKTYVDNLKLMAAHTLYDRYGQKIKLTDKLSKELNVPPPPVGWAASEKYDGIRCFWDGEKFISRGSGLGKPKVFTYVPDFFGMAFPPGVALDGELWIGRGEFQKTSRLSTLKPGKTYTIEQIDDMWKTVKFKVFDIPSEEMPFEDRMQKLGEVIKICEMSWRNEYPDINLYPIEITEHTKIESEDHLNKIYNELTSDGAEGVMIRAPGSPYETKRSKYLLKYKKQQDAECIVLEYIMGDGRLKGLLGSIKGEIIINEKRTGIFTNIGTGFSDLQRQNYLKEDSPEYIPIGSVVSFSYMEMTNDGVPRHPVYRGIRDDIHV
tara:strand:- start:6966 stop:7994 length:1029 start_codon:yes stop_codon:yes gene_type:complete